MNRKTLMVLGVVLLIIGSTGLVFSAVQIVDAVGNLPNPENDAVETLNFDGAGSKTVNLEEGEYDVWREEGDDVGNLEVTDKEGNSVFERDESMSITVDRPGSREKSYEKVGNLDTGERGAYTFETGEGCTLYVTESQPFFDIFGSMLILILVVTGSITTAIAGGGLLVWGWLKKKNCPYCGETIPENSTRCKHCNRDLTRGTYDSQGGSRYQRDGYQRQPPPPDEDRPRQRRER